MSRSTLLWTLVGCGLAALTTSIEVRRLAAAHGSLEAAHSRLAQSVQDVDRLRRLRGTEQRVLASARPEQDLVARVQIVRAAVGIPETAFRGQNPGGAEHVGMAPDGRPLKRQRVSVRLAGLAVPELGAFLAHWARTQPTWTVSRIDLVHPARGEAGRYDATIELAALSVDVEPEPGSAPR